jgi:fibronectin-binding autotransporter adhesin
MFLAKPVDRRRHGCGRFALVHSSSAAVLVFLFSMSAVPAASTWIGGMGNFSDAANWSTGDVPDGADDILVGNGGTAQVTSFNPAQKGTIDGSSTIQIVSGTGSKLGLLGELVVGQTGRGTITVGSQALLINDELANYNSFFGYSAGSEGVLQSTGGQFYTDKFYVGYEGSGTTSFLSSSQVFTGETWLGSLPGSVGVITMNDSSWSTQGAIVTDYADVTVGAQGRGDLRATNAQIEVGNVIVAATSGTGNSVTLTGGSLTSSQTIFVGQKGGGSFTATNTQIAARELFVGRDAGASGTATLSGGRLALTADLHVGALGTGTLTVLDGGTMTSDIANIGFGTNAVGLINLASGSWTNTRGLFIGVSGHGTLTLGADGGLSSESGFLGQDASGTGVVSIDGGTWAMSNSLVLGVNGTGSLSASNGARISAEWSQLGLNAGSSGTATLDGSELTVAQTLTIGRLGSGALALTNGAHLEAGAIALASSAGVSGSLNVVGSTVTTQNIISGSGTATASFSATRLQLPTNVVVVDTLLFNGFAFGNLVTGSGGLTVDTRGGNAELGSSLTGSGSLTKTGAGRLRLDTANGYTGGTFVEQGVLEFSAGSAFGTGGLTLGTSELRAITNATLSTNPTFLTVSGSQTATFSATAGNTFTVATSDFTVQNGAGLAFGSPGNTGTVVFAPVNVTTSSTIPHVTVQAGTLAAGNARLAELTAQAGATTVAAGATLAFQDNLSTGGINALFGAGTVNTGTNTATSLTVQSGTFSGSISGWGGLAKESAGTLVLSGENAFTGGTTVDGGTLLVTGTLSFGFGNVTVNPGGTLGGTGLVGGITLSGGVVSPGSSPGTLNAQSLLWEEGTLSFELGSTPATSDHLNLSSELVGLGGPGALYTFDFVDAGWIANTTYDLITFDQSDINVGSFRYSNGGAFSGAFSTNGSMLQFTLITVPEPGTISLCACAAVAGWMGRTRRRR